MKSKYQIGDRVLIKSFWSNIYHGDIITIGKDYLGIYYICKCTVNNQDNNIRFETARKKRSWNIICKN